MRLLPDTRRRLLWLAIFAIAMAQLEAAVVVYLRRLLYPEGFRFPLRAITGPLLWIELGREAATIVMLAAVGCLSCADRWRRFAAFMLLFGVWDVFYYLWLHAMDRWPQSPLTWDVLFLIPLPWVGPVAAPVLIALVMLAAALAIEELRDRGLPVRLTRGEWTATIASGLGLLVVLMWDAPNVSRGGLPSPFPWPVFLAFLACGAAAAARAWGRSRHAGTP
jgi:hypothetical protein